MAHFKDIFEVSIILGLVVVGLVITLKSGVVAMDRDKRTLILDNASRLVVALMGGVAFLLVVQQVVGYRLGAF